MRKLAVPSDRVDGLSKPVSYQPHEQSKRLGAERVAEVAQRARAGESARSLARELGVVFAILANREHRLPTVIASQTGPAHWLGELPDRVAADSIVNRLANHARTINLGQIDMRRLRRDDARANKNYWE